MYPEVFRMKHFKFPKRINVFRMGTYNKTRISLDIKKLITLFFIVLTCQRGRQWNINHWRDRNLTCSPHLNVWNLLELDKQKITNSAFFSTQTWIGENPDKWSTSYMKAHEEEFLSFSRNLKPAERSVYHFLLCHIRGIQCCYDAMLKGDPYIYAKADFYTFFTASCTWYLIIVTGNLSAIQ